MWCQTREKGEAKILKFPRFCRISGSSLRVAGKGRAFVSQLSDSNERKRHKETSFSEWHDRHSLAHYTPSCSVSHTVMAQYIHLQVSWGCLWCIPCPRLDVKFLFDSVSFIPLLLVLWLSGNPATRTVDKGKWRHFSVRERGLGSLLASWILGLSNHLNSR